MTYLIVLDPQSVTSRCYASKGGRHLVRSALPGLHQHGRLASLYLAVQREISHMGSTLKQRLHSARGGRLCHRRRRRPGPATGVPLDRGLMRQGHRDRSHRGVGQPCLRQIRICSGGSILDPIQSGSPPLPRHEPVFPAGPLALSAITLVAPPAHAAGTRRRNAYH